MNEKKRSMTPPTINVECITLDGVFGATLDGDDTIHIHNMDERKRHQDALEAMDKTVPPK